MFRQLFLAAGGKLTLLRLGFSQLQPSFSLLTITCISGRPLISKLYLRRQFCSVPSINSQLRYLSCQAAGQRMFYRGYANNARRQGSSSATASYIIAVVIFMIGAAYAGVPLYRMICQVSNDVWLFYFMNFVLYIVLCNVCSLFGHFLAMLHAFQSSEASVLCRLVNRTYVWCVKCPVAKIQFFFWTYLSLDKLKKKMPVQQKNQKIFVASVVVLVAVSSSMHCFYICEATCMQSRALMLKAQSFQHVILHNLYYW